MTNSYIVVLVFLNVIIFLKLFLFFNRGFDYKIVNNVSSASEQDFSVETSTSRNLMSI